MDLCADLENWMKNLPSKLKQTPLIQLAIPGSHDSGTSSIKWTSKIAPDAEPVVQRLKCLGPLLGIFVSRWARTQDWDIRQQITSGIRYFDLRFATKKNTDCIYIVHGQYSSKVEAILEELQTFLNEHTDEVIIIDCQHFYSFEKQNHLNLIAMFKDTFGDKLLPFYSNMEHITLDYMNANRFQIMLIYRGQIHSPQPFLWPSRKLPNPWPETDEVAVLIEKLDCGLRTRPKDVGYVSQCVLTPTDGFVLKNWFRKSSLHSQLKTLLQQRDKSKMLILGTLKSTCVKPLQNQKYQWLSQQSPGAGRLNIVISDFVNLDASKFTREVISLNGKLLTRSFSLNQSLTPVDSL